MHSKRSFEIPVRLNELAVRGAENAVRGRAQSTRYQDVMYPLSLSIMNIRDAVAITSLTLALFTAPALGSGPSAPAPKFDMPATASEPVGQVPAPASQPDATAPRQAMPPQRRASSPKETLAVRARGLQKLRIESCRRHPQTCVQPQSDSRASSAPAIAR